MKRRSPFRKPSETAEPVSPFVGIEAKTAAYPGARSWSGGRFRVRGPDGLDAHCYHVMSRTCGGEIRFDDVEKEALRRLIWKMSEFLGVKVLTYCVMSNHFHILAEVPDQAVWLKRFEGAGGEEEMLRHLATFYSRAFIHELREDLKQMRQLGMEELATARLAVFKRRFGDLSIWCKEIKERFGRWYNKRHGRKGTLWMDRFKSVLVEDGEALRTMAAYIDLNPVRAKLVDDPKDYRWCGYAEALGGGRRARRGLCRVVGVSGEWWDKAGPKQERSGQAMYRRWLYHSGKERTDREGQKVVRAGIRHEVSVQVIEREKGELPEATLARQRVRHFTQGLVLGSREWVERVFEAHRQHFGPRRRNGARPVKRGASGLFSLRALRDN